MGNGRGDAKTPRRVLAGKSLERIYVIASGSEAISKVEDLGKKCIYVIASDSEAISKVEDLGKKCISVIASHSEAIGFFPRANASYF